jgi:thiamine-phosphate pyrophosphorylase
LTNHTEAILCYVTDRRAFSARAENAALIAQIRAAAEAGVDWIQIREKDLTGRELLKLAADALAAIRAIPNSKTRILINDRLDISIAARADGVHLGEKSLPASAVRAYRDRTSHLTENHFLIGASCHSIDAAIAAGRDGVDYIFFGPVFATPSKAAFGPPQGIQILASVCRSVSIPVLAIGGVTAENISECLRAGAAGIAAIRLFQQSNELRGAVARIRANERS